MSHGRVEIRVKGKTIRVPSTNIDGRTVVVTGNWLRVASICDELVVEGDPVPEPALAISRLKESGLKVDILVFGQKLPNLNPLHDYYFEWDNVAAIPISTFENWFNERVPSDVRSAIKKAARLGVVVKLARFDDEFVRGVMAVYNETPIRQGRTFWHYQKDFDTVKRETGTYLERSTFIGAYHGNDLIGFIKLVFLGDTEAVVLQVISRTDQSNKKPTNALFAQAVQVCAAKGIRYLTYGNYVYTDPNSSLTEFKRRNGFERFNLPRYYIALTLKGRVALRLKLHRGIKALLPQRAVQPLLNVRATLMNTLKRSKLSRKLLWARAAAWDGACNWWSSVRAAHGHSNGQSSMIPNPFTARARRSGTDPGGREAERLALARRRGER